MAQRYLTYQELMDLAKEHYEEGGHATFECIDEKMFNENEEYHTLTKEKALEMFKFDEMIWKEMTCEF